MTEEIWLPIKDYEGSYEVSNLGKVRSLDRTIYAKSSGSRKWYGQEIKQWNSGGYCYVRLRKNCKKKNFTVHRLVASAFIQNTENKPAVNHIDCCKTNNQADNLEWVTNKENSIHARDNKLLRAPAGIENSNAKLTPKLIQQAIKLRELGHSCASIAQEIGISRGHAWKIVARKQWKHVN